ncbi:hypothetical protein HID58_049888, partial [Brassica napus]
TLIRYVSGSIRYLRGDRLEREITPTLRGEKRDRSYHRRRDTEASIRVDSPLLQPEHGFGLERYRYRTGERQGRKEKKEERMELICFAPSHASFFRSRLGDTCLHKPHINVS